MILTYYCSNAIFNGYNLEWLSEKPIENESFSPSTTLPLHIILENYKKKQYRELLKNDPLEEESK